MFKVISILPETTTFLVEDAMELASLLEVFKPYSADIFLDGNVAQLHVPAQKSIQIIAENTEKYKWAGGDDNVVS